ncbi:MAG: polysaccharide biosynthesis protein [Rickettsiales bacterium]
MNNDLQKAFFAGKCVAVTGAAGTVGKELIRQLLSLDVAEVIALDNNENALFYLSEQYRDEPRMHAFVSDIREYIGLRRFFEGVDYVFHTAALKHVPSCERSPLETIETNIQGTSNVVQAAIHAGVKKVLFTSTDKAVNPTNVMGTSKLMAERVITSASALCRAHQDVAFASSRFGNVLGSAGSVIPLFIEQIKSGKPITLTDPKMIRFVMTLRSAVDLMLETMRQFKGGEVFVMKMPVVNLKDLADTLIEAVAPVYGFSPSAIETKIIGSRPGEKLYEEVMTEEEVGRTLEIKDFMVIRPAFESQFKACEYNYEGGQTLTKDHYKPENQPLLSKEQIFKLLMEEGVLPAELRQQIELNVPKKLRLLSA